jgi:hypothetical protein
LSLPYVLNAPPIAFFLICQNYVHEEIKNGFISGRDSCIKYVTGKVFKSYPYSSIHFAIWYRKAFQVIRKFPFSDFRFILRLSSTL